MLSIFAGGFLLPLEGGEKMVYALSKWKMYVRIALFLGALGVLATPVMGQYILDQDFADGGIQTTAIGNFDDRGFAAALQADGKIVVAGTSENGSDADVAVVRYNTDGSLDTSFAGNGTLTIQLGSENDGANDVVVRDDGSIIVAGYLEESGEKKFALARITSAGVLDIDFGGAGSGIITLEEAGKNGEAFSLAVDSDNRLLVAGVFRTSSEEWIVVARYLADGILDTSFGKDGYTRLESDGKTSAAFLVLQSDAGIIVGRTKTVESVARAALFRFDENGAMDSGFGGSGEALLSDSFSPSGFLKGTVLADNSVVAVGYTTADGQQKLSAAKFLSSGQIDTSFGTSGEGVIDTAINGVAYSVEAEQDGSFLVAGTGSTDGGDDIVLAHLAADGSGVLSQTNSIDVNGADDGGRAVVAGALARRIVAGFAGDGVDDDIALLAFTKDSTEAQDLGQEFGADDPYIIETAQVSNVHRNEAVSGGLIVANSLYVCGEDEGQDCRPEVTKRGVVYSVTPYPELSETEDESDSTELDEAVDEAVESGSLDSDAEDSATGDGDTESTLFAGADTTGSGNVFPEWLQESSFNYTIVRRGRTTDGKGTGSYRSVIVPITPDVFYYVRAYAVLDDGTVIYGKQLTFTTEAACFIATAAYGSVLAPHVAVLSAFRDKYLKTTAAGRKFVQLYYHFSPSLAESVSHSWLLRKITQALLLPLVGVSYCMLYPAIFMKILVILVTTGVFFCSRRMRRKQHKHFMVQK
jgi:uncharacterized delta-60 repeat protein